LIQNLISYVDLVEKILVPHPNPNSSRKNAKMKGNQSIQPIITKIFFSKTNHNKVPANWSAAINGCSLPIDSQMVGALQFETH
jgi:hypothetical protein